MTASGWRTSPRKFTETPRSANHHILGVPTLKSEGPKRKATPVMDMGHTTFRVGSDPHFLLSRILRKMTARMGIKRRVSSLNKSDQTTDLEP